MVQYCSLSQKLSNWKKIVLNEFNSLLCMKVRSIENRFIFSTYLLRWKIEIKKQNNRNSYNNKTLGSLLSFCLHFFQWHKSYLVQKVFCHLTGKTKTAKESVLSSRLYADWRCPGFVSLASNNWVRGLYAKCCLHRHSKTSTITIHKVLCDSLLDKWQIHFQRTYQVIRPCATSLCKH